VHGLTRQALLPCLLQVLPADAMVLAEPAPADLLAALEEALVRVGRLDPVEQHARVRGMYSWNDVAQRTVQVYDNVMASSRWGHGRVAAVGPSACTICMSTCPALMSAVMRLSVLLVTVAAMLQWVPFTVHVQLVCAQLVCCPQAVLSKACCDGAHLRCCDHL
jgi:hypothetical protein